MLFSSRYKHFVFCAFYLQSCKEQRGGASSVTIIKYAIKKYPSVEMDKKTKNLYKKALKRLVEKGAVRQVTFNVIASYCTYSR